MPSIQQALSAVGFWIIRTPTVTIVIAATAIMSKYALSLRSGNVTRGLFH